MADTAEDKTAAGEAAVPQVALDLELCKVCGICIDLCPEDVFDRGKLGYPVVARADDCTSCLLCELHCPDFAIEVERRARKKPAEGATATPEAIAAAECGVHSGGDD